MNAYTVVLVTVCYLAIGAHFLADRSQQIVVRMLVAVLTAFAALRGYVGTDTGAYHDLFDRAYRSGLTESVSLTEPLFGLLLWATAAASDNSFVFVATIAVVQGVLLMLVASHLQRPALWFALYAATFYVNLHFNILRQGLAGLFLLLSVIALMRLRRGAFHGYGWLGVMSHYSTVLYFAPLNMAGRRVITGLILFLVTAAAAIGAIYLFVSAGRVLQYASYLIAINADAQRSYGLGLFVLFGLYALLFGTVVTRRNFSWLAPLFVLWFALRLTSNYFLFVDRIEIIINLLLLFAVLALDERSPVRGLRTFVVVLLVCLNLYGGLGGLRRADEGSRVIGVQDPDRRASPYLPYRFYWEE